MMKIGYPCINRSIGCSPNSTFRLRSYSKENILMKVRSNLECLQKILAFNVNNGLLFFRIGSGLVPFASHPVNKVAWEKEFYKDFLQIGKYIQKHDLRISMHPDQFVLLNAQNSDIVHRSILELEYHAKVLDAFGLDKSAKIQIHVGGIYGDKKEAVKRFCRVYAQLPASIKKRLVIENDDRCYSVKDCLEISRQVGIPIIFDTFHHDILSDDIPLSQAFDLVKRTWKKQDGVPMIDYSAQQKNARIGAHAHSIDIAHFRKVMAQLTGEFDVMLEIKDKEKSALKALKAL